MFILDGEFPICYLGLHRECCNLLKLLLLLYHLCCVDVLHNSFECLHLTLVLLPFLLEGLPGL